MNWRSGVDLFSLRRRKGELLSPDFFQENFLRRFPHVGIGLAGRTETKWCYDIRRAARCRAWLRGAGVAVEIAGTTPCGEFLMSESKLVWTPLKKAVKGFWMRLEIANFAGFPDTIVLQPDGRVALVELKYLPSWPVRASTTTTLKVRGIQGKFLREWVELSGRGYVLARVADEWLLIRGNALGDFTREQWYERAVHTSDGMPDFREIEKLL